MVVMLYKWVLQNVILKKPPPEDDENSPYRLRRSFGRLTIALFCLSAVTEIYYQHIPFYLQLFGNKSFFALLLASLSRYVLYMAHAELCYSFPPVGGVYTFVSHLIGELPAFLLASLVLLRCFLNGLQSLGLFSFSLWTVVLRERQTLVWQKHIRWDINPWHDLDYMATVPAVLAFFLLFNVHRTKNIIGAIVLISLLFVVVVIVTLFFSLNIFDVVIHPLRQTSSMSRFLFGCQVFDLFLTSSNILLSTGDEAVNPRRDIPQILLSVAKYSIFINLFGTITMMAGNQLLDESSREGVTCFSTLLSRLGHPVLSAVIQIGEFFLSFSNVFVEMYIGTRVFHSLARKGMFFEVFARLTRTSGKAPYVSTILVFIIAVVGGLFIRPTFYGMVAAMICQHIFDIFVVICVLIMRYKAHVLTTSEENDIYDEDYDWRWAIINYPKKLRIPTKKTARISYLCIAIGFFSCTAIVILFQTILITKYNGVFWRSLLLFSFLCFILSFMILLCQPKNRTPSPDFRLEGVPYTAYVLFLYLVTHLTSYWCFYFELVFITLGIALLFYSIRKAHFHFRRTKKEK